MNLAAVVFENTESSVGVPATASFTCAANVLRIHHNECPGRIHASLHRSTAFDLHAVLPRVVLRSRKYTRRGRVSAIVVGEKRRLFHRSRSTHDPFSLQ